MSFETQYRKGLPVLLNNKKINETNRELFKKFFEYQEYKLKRMNSLAKLDESSYKTLCFYLSRLRTVNVWFKNKAWKDLSREDIKKVYDNLEDGKIKNRFGNKYNTQTFYKTILRGKPFELAGKKDLAKEVMEFYSSTKKKAVRFIREADFRKLVDTAMLPEHKLFLWLCFDIGENSNSILQLRKQDCQRQINEYTKEPEYLVNLREGTLKRSRTARREPSNYKETVELLDLILKDKSDSNNIFNFEYRNAKKIMERVTRITKVKCIPEGQRPALKDLRSSMACDLLSKGWTTDEINARLGHTPSSRELDPYVNFLALEKNKPKRKMQEFQVAQLKDELETVKRQANLENKRMREETEGLKNSLEELKKKDNDVAKKMLAFAEYITNKGFKNLSKKEIEELKASLS